jgi:hypothetical protein
MPRRAFIMTVMEHFPHLAEAIQASLRDEADRACFYAQMLLHRFHDPLTRTNCGHLRWIWSARPHPCATAGRRHIRIM